MAPIIHWFRRDLRIADNTALDAAVREGSRVVPVFVLDDHYANGGVGSSRFRFLRESLDELDESLRHRGGRLIVREGPASRALPALLAETGASAVYANAEIGPYPESRDRQTATALAAAGAMLRLFPDALLVEPDAILSRAGEPYTVFSSFARAWDSVEKRPPVAAPLSVPTPDLPTLGLGRVRAWRGLPPDPHAPRGGEREARRLLDRFLSGPLEIYAIERDLPDREGTSRLSPHLHFGTISPRTIAEAVRSASSQLPAAGTSPAKFRRELAWREFLHHVLHHFPRVATESFRREFDGMEWEQNESATAAWRAGGTGYPFVDAGMRQLLTTHWMHNRARMAAASFLTKDLHVHWRTGEHWFEHELADADQANNNGGWQWAAGTGTDAAPFFRIFNPVLQSKKFDPDGGYIRRFVPELSRVPPERIHEPWTMTASEQAHAGCRIGIDYPAPIVDHAKERTVALEKAARLRK